MATAPTPIPAAPPGPDSSVDEPTFDAQYQAFNTYEADTLVPGMNALGQNVYENALLAEEAVSDAEDAVTAAADSATAAADSASAAAGSAGAAAGSAGAAAGSASTASTHATTATTQAGLAATARTDAQTARTGAEAAQGLAEDARDDAAASAAAAQIFATQQLVGSSSTSLTPGAGNKNFTMETGRAFVPGMYLVATSTGTPSAKMAGYVTSYNGGTGALVINVDAFGGTGAHADWVIGVAVAGQVGGATTQIISSNTPVTPGVKYIVAASGITLDMTGVSWMKGDYFGIREAIGAGTYTINFGTTKDRTQTRGSQLITAGFRQLDRTYEDATRGLI